jgi:F-type H+-transporting ATPase subunit a
MQEHELWFTKLFNDFAPGLGSSILNLVGVHAENPARPWANFITMQILVFFLVVVVFAMLRPRLSMDKPGTFQHVFELIYEFLRDLAEDIIGHEGKHYLSFCGTLFLFILFGNLLGVVPTFESPTMFPYVPAGCAIAAFLYYNVMGFRANGVSYVKHYMGPIPLLTPLMLPIEVISNLARPISLTIRLFANMYAGEMVTLVFMSLVPVAVPAVFMGLHVFVALLQAYIFTLLTMVYISGAVAHEH